MINKRLLIKNLLSHNDENSFYDKKQKLVLESKEGKAKFIKHICALSNSNPENNSYLIIGVNDENNEIIGVDFYDDSKIQNLVNAYLFNPPKIQYENVPFPRLQRHKVIGLVTIFANKKVSSLSKNAWKYKRNTIFYRRGSNSMPFLESDFVLKNSNVGIVTSVENSARNNIKLTLDGVFDFMSRHKKEYNPEYKVFNEQFVLCWAGKKKTIKNETYYTRVDIELINEQVRLFFSALDDVKIYYNNNSFIVTEYIELGIENEKKHYPLEKTVINFKNNGKHDIVTEFLFSPPTFNEILLKHIYQNSLAIVSKLKSKKPLSVTEHEDVLRLPTNLLLCFLQGYENAPELLKETKEYIKSLEDKTTYVSYKEVMRVLRKVKYG